jgi:hypothetical protein
MRKKRIATVCKAVISYLKSKNLQSTMAEIIRMPKMSDTMTEGVVAKWHKKVGDSVRRVNGRN